MPREPKGSSRNCTLECPRYYARLHAERHGMTPEQQHDDEECPLAHVTATRAKDRLVFVSTRRDSRGRRPQLSSLEEACLRQLPVSVLKQED